MDSFDTWMAGLRQPKYDQIFGRNVRYRDVGDRTGPADNVCGVCAIGAGIVATETPFHSEPEFKNSLMIDLRISRDDAEELLRQAVVMNDDLRLPFPVIAHKLTQMKDKLLAKRKPSNESVN